MDEKMKALQFCRIFEPSVPISSQEAHSIFAAIEADLGRSLPADYKEFVREYGQCGFEAYVAAPVEPRFPLGTRCMITAFFGMRVDHDYFVLKERETYRGRMPLHVLPIAEDPGGNIFVLSGGGDDHGAVFYWDHEHVDLPRGRVTEMAGELEREGVESRRLSVDQIVLEWERRHRDALGRPPGYGNLYRSADSFSAFIDSLQPYDPDSP
jgi:hypothetical protein